MPRTALAATLLTVVVTPCVTAACGAGDPAQPGLSPGATSASAPTTAVARFPLTISRSGGIAGFADRVTVEADGAVRGTTKSGQVSCTLDPASLATLTRGAAEITDSDRPTVPTSPPADAMTVLLAAGAGQVSLGDPRLATAEPVVTQLLADVTGPAAARRICT